MTTYSDYDRFAWVYNKHWGNHFTPTALAVLEKLALLEVWGNACILDLCCGTGQLARELSERGYAVTGLDGSDEMLRFARENAPDLQFILEDARTFKLPDRYDVVVSMFDSLNHIMTLDELTSVFHNVHTALHQGGFFLFDLNMEEGYKTNWNDDHSIVEEDHVCVIRSSYYPEKHTAQFDATIFYKENGWQRSNLTLLQKCYSESEILSALEVAGFIEILSYAYNLQRGLVELTTDAARAFFTCQKPLQTHDS